MLWNVRSVNDDGVCFVLLIDLVDLLEELFGEEDVVMVEWIVVMVEWVNEVVGVWYWCFVYFVYCCCMFVLSEGVWMGEG